MSLQILTDSTGTLSRHTGRATAHSLPQGQHAQHFPPPLVPTAAAIAAAALLAVRKELGWPNRYKLVDTLL